MHIQLAIVAVACLGQAMDISDYSEQLRKTRIEKLNREKEKFAANFHDVVGRQPHQYEFRSVTVPFEIKELNWLKNTFSDAVSDDVIDWSAVKAVLRIASLAPVRSDELVEMGRKVLSAPVHGELTHTDQAIAIAEAIHLLSSIGSTEALDILRRAALVSLSQNTDILPGAEENIEKDQDWVFKFVISTVTSLTNMERAHAFLEELMIAYESKPYYRSQLQIQLDMLERMMAGHPNPSNTLP